jgi:hypothetical protein
MIAIIILVVAIVGVVVVAIIFFSLIGGIGPDPWEETSDFDSDVHIEEDGHFRFLLTENWGDELRINVSILLLNGSQFDVYIMDTNQYENAYGNQSTGAFSSTFKWENVRGINESMTIDSLTSDLYLIIDNIDMPHVPGSATPVGPIHVDVVLETSIRWNTEW